MDGQAAGTDVVIVGGGLAGLTAASYLARAGKTVTLLEQSSRLGGRAASQQYEGFWFNRGIHALYTGGAASEVLEDLGIRYPHGKPGPTFVLEHRKLHAFPADPITLVRSRLLGTRDKLELLRVLVGLGRADPRQLAGISVKDWIASAARRPRVRRLLTAVARPFVYSPALDLVSAEVFVAKLQRALRHPVHYVDGGWQTLVEALRGAAVDAGARLLPGTAVEAVEHHAGHAHGVRLRSGELISAHAVVVATSPGAAVRLLDEGSAAGLRRAVDRRMAVRVACLDVALRRLPNRRHPVVFDAEQARLLSAQSLYAQVAPAGAAMVAAFKQLDPRCDGDPAADERDLEDMLDTVQPGWRDVLVKRIYLPRIKAVGMLPLARDGGFGGRPGPGAAGIDGLYLAGDWIGDEGFLVDASLASARRAAWLILEDRPRAGQRSEEPALAVV